MIHKLSSVVANRKVQVLGVVLIFLLGFLFRLSFVGTRGFSIDLRMFVQWARLMARYGLGAVYEQTPSAYPPLGTILLWPVGLMCPQCGITSAPAVGELLVLRLLCTGFDMLNVAVLFHLGQKTRWSWMGLVAAAVYALFPTMVLVSGWWGQNDAWFLFFMLLAGIGMRRAKPVRAWTFLALSILIKFQAIILLPVFVAGTWRWFGWKRLVLSAGVFLSVVGLFCTPVIVGGQWDRFVATITLPIRQDPVLQESHLTMGGYNLWAGIALLKRLDIDGSYRHTLIPGITFQAAGMALLIIGLALVAVRIFINSGFQSVFVAMAASWIVFFQFAVGSGARYLLPAMALMVVVASEYPAWWALCIGFCMSVLLNLQNTVHRLQYPFPYISLPGGTGTNIILTIVLSVVTMGLFLVQTGHLRWGGGRFRANRLERVLILAGAIVLVIVLGVWLAQSAGAQCQLEREGIALTDSMSRQLDDATDILVINWPKEVSQAFPDGYVVPPATGLVEPDLAAMGAFSATAVIYPPWAETVSQVYHWNASYHGYHVTSEMLIERIFEAKRVVTANMLTAAPYMWRLAEIVDMDAESVPVAQFGRQVWLMDACMEYHDQILFIHLGWNVRQQLSDDVTVFIHLLGPDGRLMAQADGDTINNLIPLGQWYRYPDKIGRETRTLLLPPEVVQEDYAVAVGLYDRLSLERLDVLCEQPRCQNQAYLLEPGAR